MPTDFELLLGEASSFLEAARPETVTIAGYPQPLQANIGATWRRDVLTDTGWRKQTRGTVEIRREILAAAGDNLPEPATGMQITVRGTTYAIDFTTGDPVTLRVEFANFL